MILANYWKNIVLFFIFIDLTPYFQSSASFLRLGRPLVWKKSLPHLHSVRLGGVQQFIKHYQRCSSLELPQFYWGDEIEYGVFALNSRLNYDLSKRGTKIRERLSKQEKTSYYSDLPIGCEWQPEYGSWMVESVPKNPYGSYLSDLMNVEKSMQLRRKRLHSALLTSSSSKSSSFPVEIAPTLSNFPMLGVTDEEKGYEHGKNRFGEIANSSYLSDAIINPHPRMGCLTRNIRERRQSNVDIKVPLDETPLFNPGEEQTDQSNAIEKSSSPPKLLHLDAMAFGMGCCCLQVTMQCRNEGESRYLHDQLAILAPLLQCLSAATPVMQGQFVGTDTRWNIISQAVDDRTPVERGLINDQEEINHLKDPHLVGHGIQSLKKSRYSTVSSYLAKPQNEQELTNMKLLNDLPLDINPETYQLLQSSGIDEILSLHIAHLFTRDPLVIFDDAIALDNDNSLDHWENIQSTNWRSMRWKPPSLKIGKEFANRKEILLHQTQKRLRELTLLDDYNEEGEVGGEEERDFDHNILFEDRFDCSKHHSNSNTEDPESNNNNSHQHQSHEKSSDQHQLNDEIPSPAASEHTHIIDPLHSMNGNTNTSSNLSSQSSSSSVRDFDDLQSHGPGWRIEFRPLEVQLTDYENAAFAIFTVLLTRCIASQGHNFYLPISYMEENMKRAQLKDAVLNQKFFIRRNAIRKKQPLSSTTNSSTTNSDNTTPSIITPHPLSKTTNYHIPSLEEIEVIELTMNEIFNGEKDSAAENRFIGLIPMILDYLSSLGCNDQFYLHQELIPYFSLLSDRASGKLPTTARWIRNQLIQSYRHRIQSSSANNGVPTADTEREEEEIITPQAINELLKLADDIGMGRIQRSDLYGSYHHPINNLDVIEEEDLMFTNFSCYLKPVDLDLKTKLNLSEGVNLSIMSEEKNATATAVLQESKQPSYFEMISNMVTDSVKSLFQRKKRNKQESIRY